MIKTSFLLACIALTGCAQYKTRVESSSPRTVVVASFIGIAGAQETANNECKKYDRYARYATTIEGTIDYVFDCVQ